MASTLKPREREDKARAGEALVSDAVKELLMSQSQICSRHHGVHQLKGVPERWRLYRVEP